MDADARSEALRIRPDATRHPGMHQTSTVDYIVLLSGEGQVDLKPFDPVVQRGANHAWVNYGAEPATLTRGVIISTQVGRGSRASANTRSSWAGRRGICKH